MLFRRRYDEKMTELMDNNAIEVAPKKEIVDFFRSLKDEEVEAKWQHFMCI